MRVTRWLAATAAACPVLLAAQGEPITIRLAPVANQTVHMRMAQETAMDFEPNDTTTVSIPAMKLALTVTIATTIDVGAADDQGRVEARITYDDVTFDATMNGQPVPMPALRTSLEGRAVTMVYDRDGRIVDFKVDGIADPMFAALRPMMSSLFGASTGNITLAVGETVTRPMEFSLPIPNASPLGGFTFEAKFTLNSVTAEGADRIAHLTTAIAGQMKPRAAGPDGATAAIDMQLSGSGTMDVNVD